MPGNYTFFAGSTFFAPFADSFGLRVDQVNFVVCQLISLPASLILYFYLSPRKTSRTVRLLFHLLFGLSICFFCFGPAIKHLIFDAATCYGIMRWGPTRFAHQFVFVVAMAYLSFIHFYRVYFAPIHLIDVTGPMMVLTQKLTSLAFSVHDGKVKTKEELTRIQKRERVEEIPSFLEFFSYAFAYHGILCGPVSFYSDYIAFIDGRHYAALEKEKTDNNNEMEILRIEPSPWRAVVEKFSLAMVFLWINAIYCPRYPIERIFDEDKCFLGKLWYAMISQFMTRAQYYYAWIMSDTIINASGFGFNGFSSDGRPRWDLVSNVKVWEFETATSWKECLESWNCTTMYWLRRVAYERVPREYRTWATYLLSAIWHGFWPGYYLTFLTGALFTTASRVVRTHLRPYFLDTKWKKLFYDILTFIAVKIAITYAATTFVLLHFMISIRAYKVFYGFMHIGSFAVIFGMPKVLHKKRAVKNEEFTK